MKKYIFTPEQLQAIKPLCLEEREYRTKKKIPNPMWAFDIVKDFFMK